ncbi:MAG TPA: hypothetical protein VFA01_00025 [Candidatus Dormibacteraeota bacterium]|jgi:hypothetical protein|nr:hypothetical protein [Candidatus Dormibacteraeota bacterium]
MSADGPSFRTPDPAETVADQPGRYTTLDEAGMESFPASDPIAVDVDEPIRGEDGEPADR